MQTHLYDPYKWLPTLFRSMKEYIESGIDAAFKAGSTPVGLQAYEIIFDFPTARLEPRLLPFTNEDGKPITLIHLEIDNIDNQPLGFGTAEFAETLNPGSPGEIVPEEAHGHEVRFDVGVWATDSSGGSTSRLDAYGALDSILSGPEAVTGCREATGGVLIRSFGGGRFLTEAVNDIRLYRVADMELVTHVFSSKLLIGSSEGEIVIVPELLIDETIIIDVEP